MRNHRLDVVGDGCAWIDTLFGLPESVMFQTLVDYLDRTKRDGAPADDYTGLFDDMSALGTVDVALVPVWGWRWRAR